jgi:hypothetical protein
LPVPAAGRAELKCPPRLGLPENVRQFRLRLRWDRTVAAAGAGRLPAPGRAAAQSRPARISAIASAG